MNALLRGPGDFEPDDTSARDVAVERAGEEIEKDADKVRELVVDNLDSYGSPLCGDTFSAELMVSLRELRGVFGRLAGGDTLDEATKTPDEAARIQALLRASAAADNWIAGLIEEAADDAVTEADACAYQDRGDRRADDLNGGL